MTHRPSPRPHPVTLDQARADDLLLDALGQDEPAPEGDEIAELLAAWRADLAEPLLDEVPTPARSFTGWRVRLVAAAALVTVATAGTSLAAANAGPDSPLWPVTQIVNPGHADVVTAQATLDQARRAITEGRQADARRLLDQAPGQIAKVRDPVAAQRLRDELDALRKSLTALVPGAPASVPAVRPAPGSSGTGTGTGGGATPTPTPTTGQPSGGTGSGGGGGGGILPSPLPSLPLPSLPSLPPILK